MEKSIRIRILGREYPLIVREEDEDLTRDIAAYVSAKMQAFKEAHPEQSDIVTAVFTALALAEELHTTWDAEAQALQSLDEDLNALDRRLEEALADSHATNGTAPTSAGKEG